MGNHFYGNSFDPQKKSLELHLSWAVPSSPGLIEKSQLAAYIGASLLTPMLHVGDLNAHCE